MRRLLRNSKKRGEKKETDPFDESRGASGKFVEPDTEAAPSEHGHRALVEAGESAIDDPVNWATERRRSQASRRSGYSSKSGSPGRSSRTSRASRASYDDVYSDEVAVESILNPDVEAQIDADSDEYDTYNIPKPGTKEKMPKVAHKKGTAKNESDSKRGSVRLSSRLSKLLSKTTKAPKEKEKKKGASIKETLVKQSQRLSFRKPASPEKQAAKAAKLRAKQEKKDEERRLREIRSNPWYPAGVDFKFLSPKPKWMPFMGRKGSAAELDFGNEARLVGATA